MRIAYKKRQLHINLIFGIIWLCYFLILLLFNDGMHWYEFFWVFISLCYFVIYFYQKKYQYLSIENDKLIVNGPFGKQLALSDIKRIKYYAGDYIIKTETKELTINTQLIDPNALTKLNTELQKLDIDWI